jgi:hypothetical protein
MWITIPIGLTSALNFSIVLGFPRKNINRKLDSSSSSDGNWEKLSGLVDLVERTGLYLGSLMGSNSFY